MVGGAGLWPVHDRRTRREFDRAPDGFMRLKAKQKGGELAATMESLG